MLNSQLGDDSSPTDRLVIDGGSASGDTGLRVINAGGEGAYTTHGIRLVQTINGATTAADAFHLDAGSTGYRASADTLALNGYDYSLVRGGNDGVADDWYLTSSDAPPPGPIDPPIRWTLPILPIRQTPALPCLRQKARATGTSRRKAVPGPATGAPPCACSRTACATATPAPPTPMRAAPGARCGPASMEATTAACAWPRVASISRPTAPWRNWAWTCCAPRSALMQRCASV